MKRQLMWSAWGCAVAVVLWMAGGVAAEEYAQPEPAPLPGVEAAPTLADDQAAAFQEPAPEPPLPARTVADQPLVNAEETLLVSRAFMDAIIAGDTQAAFHLLAPYFPVPDAKLEELEKQTAYQLRMLRVGFGVPLETILLKEERAGDVLVRHLYLERFERDALRWELAFYRAHRGWILNAVAFDTDLDTLFE
jgi:hypothetical protein